MEKEVRVEAPVTIAGITVVPVVETAKNRWSARRGFSFLGFKQPVSVIIVTSEGKKAFNMDGEELSLEQLGEEFPAIKEALAEL
jgi:hypothetical protein